MARCTADIERLTGISRSVKKREARELAETLHNRMKEAKYFRHQELMYIKYLSPERIEVVFSPDCLSFEAFNSRWMDTICDSVIVSQPEYQEAVTSVLEGNKEVCCG
ncbi:hypothetical protein ACFQT0_19650 [Hymenobacter humi]|uniref:Uncharacterized protein n=1 Tax=Hymenobacter humi TaxID=1411620 RepID=A0ABW2U8B9_9BACT